MMGGKVTVDNTWESRPFRVTTGRTRGCLGGKDSDRYPKRPTPITVGFKGRRAKEAF